MLRNFFLIVIGLGFCMGAVWAEGSFPKSAKITAGKIGVFAKAQIKGPVVEELSRETTLVLLEDQGSSWKVVYPSSRRVFIREKLLRTNSKNMGIVLANYTGVFSSPTAKKPMARLQKGDRVTIEKREKGWCLVTSPDLFFVGYLSKKGVSPVKTAISEKFQGVLLTRFSKPKVDPLWKQIKTIKEKLQRELAKKIEEMDLQKLIFQCGKLQQKTQRPQLKRMISYLYRKAQATEKMRQNYLKLTAPLRKNIEKNLK